MSDPSASAPDGCAPRVTLTITNKRGLHARASACLVRLVETFQAQIIVSKDGASVGGTSIMGLMLLAAGPGDTIDVRAHGADADAALAAITALVEDRFGEGE